MANNNHWASNFPPKKGVCRICEASGYTEWHHIISRGKSGRIGRSDLITNINNVVELCKSCHELTTSSGMKRRYDAQEKYVCKSCNEIGHFTDDCPDRKKERFRNIPAIPFFTIKNILFKNCKNCGRKWHHEKCTYDTYCNGIPMFIPDHKVISITREAWEDNVMYRRILGLALIALILYYSN